MTGRWLFGKSRPKYRTVGQPRVVIRRDRPSRRLGQFAGVVLAEIAALTRDHTVNRFMGGGGGKSGHRRGPHLPITQVRVKDPRCGATGREAKREPL
jgi:hypothetical protein